MSKALSIYFYLRLNYLMYLRDYCQYNWEQLQGDVSFTHWLILNSSSIKYSFFLAIYSSSECDSLTYGFAWNSMNSLKGAFFLQMKHHGKFMALFTKYSMPSVFYFKNCLYFLQFSFTHTPLGDVGLCMICSLHKNIFRIPSNLGPSCFCNAYNF